VKLTEARNDDRPSYRLPVALRVADFTAAVGTNDVEKGALLATLQIFFDHQAVGPK
jgi:hypothetical protein